MQLQIEQDTVDTLAPLAQEFLEKVLSMDAAQVLLTDLSSLSDFTGQGELPSNLQALANAAAYKDFCRAWDRWVLERVQVTFGIRVERTTAPLVQLLVAIEESRKPRTLH